MATERVEAIFKSVSQKLEEIVPSERFYVVLYDPTRKNLSFPFIRHDGAVLSQAEFPWLMRSIHSEDVLPDWVITHGESMLVESGLSAHLETKQIGYWPNNPFPESWLGVPLTIGEQVLGALVVESWDLSHSLNQNAHRVLSTIARQTATAIEKIRLYEQLERKVFHLQTLNDLGQQLMKGLAKQESEILDLVHMYATQLDLDTSSLFIAFYEANPAVRDSEGHIYGNLRYALAYQEGRKASIPNRPVSNGLTEYVIRTKQSFNAPEVEATHQEFKEEEIDKIPRSWLGVPMIAEGQVFGVIALRNYEVDHAFTQGDQSILEILSGQVAISLLNLRYYQALQRETTQRISVEKTAIMSTMAAEFAHKMNNIAGTIPIRVNLAKTELEPGSPRDERILKQLDKIESETKNLLSAAQAIRESADLGKSRSPEIVDVNELLETAIARAKHTQINSQNTVQTYTKFEPNLPQIKVDRNTLLDTLTSIIKNGFEAIVERGEIMVTSYRCRVESKPGIEITIHDNGKGIPPTDLPKIFDLLYTTKGEKGLGFGLWRDRVFIKNIGGDIDVTSEVNHGSTFIIRIPIDQTAP
jgi:signal transduction histidine kinase